MNPENQFDFWLAHGMCRGARTAKAQITGDLHGLSLSAYDAERNLWCQTWVDNRGFYLDFTGEFEDGKMILTRDAIVKGKACKQRMVWYNIETSQVDWNWERSDDGGVTWRVLWQIQYMHKP